MKFDAIQQKGYQTLWVLCGLVALNSSFSLRVRGDVLVEDFNTERVYGTCCGEFGTYLSFETNVTQNGSSGTIVVSGSATENGGFYRDLGGAVLWNFTSQSNLTLTAKRIAGNAASNCWIILRDTQARSAGYSFPMSGFSTNSFSTFSIPLGSPSWVDPSGFNFSFITAFDVNGGMTDDDLPFKIEIDEIKLTGPSPSNLPFISASILSNTFSVSWLSLSSTSWQFQTASSITGVWNLQTNIVTVGNLSSFTQPATGSHRFFRLKNPSGSSFRLSDSAQAIGRGYNLLVNDEGAATISAASGPQPTNTVFTNTFIDTASKTRNWARGQFGSFGGVPPNNIGDDLEIYGHEERNSHSGGVIAVTNINYKSHTPSSTFPLWSRTTDCISQTVRITTFTPGDFYWPGGYYTSTSSGCNPSSNFSNAVNEPFPEWVKVQSISWNDILWIGGDTLTNWATRNDLTTIHLHTSLSQKYVLLSGSASNVVSFEGGVDFLYSDTFISPTNITVVGSQLNADGKAFKKVSVNATYDATPSVVGSTNYGFSVEIEDHPKTILSRSYHPLFEVPPFTVPVPKLSEIQSHFDDASIFLSRDDDQKIHDSAVSSSTNSTSTYRSDDVPAYVEFVLTNAPPNTNFFTRKTGPVFPTSYRARKYYRVQSDTDANALLNSEGANIKLVRSLKYNGNAVDGLAVTPSSPARMLIIHTLPGVVGAHEWGHTRGLSHRGTPNNVGPTAGALMNATNFSSANKINRFERGSLN